MVPLLIAFVVLFLIDVFEHFPCCTLFFATVAFVLVCFFLL